MKSPEQRGHYGALCLYQIIVPSKIRMKSRLVISLSNTSCSVDDCAKSEIAYCPYGPVRGPSTIFQPRTGPYGQYTISDLSQSAFKMHTQVAAGALIFIFRQSYKCYSYVRIYCCKSDHVRLLCSQSTMAYNSVDRCQLKTGTRPFPLLRASAVY